MQTAIPTGALSDAARVRMLSLRGEPFWISDWKRAVFIHFEVDPEVLQREVPFELDLYQGKAYVSLVAFDLERMRPRMGGAIAAALMRPVASHGFLNIRTYVRHRGEAGIFFLAEYLPNRLSVYLGPRLYGLPYRHGLLDYRHNETDIEGRVQSKTGTLAYSAIPLDRSPSPCDADTLDEFLLERYTAFTQRGETKRFFRIWHQPWPQRRLDVRLQATTLLSETGRWFTHAELVGAHFSPGLSNVWMGCPRRC